MEAKKINIKDIPNFDPISISSIHRDNFDKVKQAGGKIVSESGEWGTFEFSQDKVDGEVWVGFNAPQYARNTYRVGNITIKTCKGFETEVL